MSTRQPVDEGPGSGECLFGKALPYHVESDGQAVIVLGELLFIVRHAQSSPRHTAERVVAGGTGCRAQSWPMEWPSRARRLNRPGSRPRSMG